MSVSILCLSCGAKVRVSDKAAGRSFKCPKCGDPLHAPSPSLPPPPRRRTTPQTIAVNCPHCKTKLSVEAGSVGRMASCPMCGGTFPLTADGEMPSPQTEPNPPHSNRSEEPEEREPEEREPKEWEPEEREPEEQKSLDYDDEPWFYGHLEKYAKNLQSLAYVIAAGCAVFATIGFIWVRAAIFSEILGAAIGVNWTLVSFLGWVFCMMWIVALLRLWLVGVAAILLAVDAARNIRAMKTAATTVPTPRSAGG